MSAESFGGSLLAGLEEESLDKLLRSFRRLGPEDSVPRLGIPGIDCLLDIFQFHARQTAADIPDSSTFVENTSSSKAPVIEITGCSGSGKTHIVYATLSRAVLPRVLINGSHKFSIGGQNGAAVVLDTDNRFSASRLRQVMMSYVKDRCALDSNGDVLADDVNQKFAESHMRHIHVFRPTSTSSLLSTIKSIRTHLLNYEGHFSGDRPLRLLVIDSATAFYWSDRLAIEEAPVLPSADGVLANQWPEIVRALREVQAAFDCTVIATSWGLYPTNNDYATSSQMYKPCIPVPWLPYCTLRLNVTRCPREQVATSQANELIEDRMNDAFEGRVDGWGSSEWPEGVRAGIQKVEKQGKFLFWIGNGGIIFEEK